MKTVTRKKTSTAKPKISKEERRRKYTNLARGRSFKNRQRNEQRDLICYNCRQRGHSFEHCPQTTTESTASSIVKKCCYKCGGDHSLSVCPKGDTILDLPFATCFVCSETGHLASQCTKNTNGIYVHGGACSVCGSKSHLAKNCDKRPNLKKREDDVKSRELPSIEQVEFENFKATSSDEFISESLNFCSKLTDHKVSKKRKVVKF